MLEVENMVKKFGDFEAVKGISFDVEEGEVFGLLGPNGAGKTTTISMITGLYPPTSGTARIDGHDILKEPLLVKQMNGLVPQDLALYPTLSARANLQFFGRVYGLGGKKLKENVEDVLRVVSLTDRADQAIEKYSGGMKRRVNIAAGLVHQPRLLFLDEPTVGVDPQSRNHIFESVQRLNRERGMSIIYTSHYMEEVELLCNRVAIIDQGKLIAMDSIKNLVAMLGGGVLRIGVRKGDEHLLSALSQLPAVKNASLLQPVSQPIPEGQTPDMLHAQPVVVKIETQNSQQALIHVINYLEDQNIALLSLDILENNLESVFLHLTGKQLRE
ncbi:MAG: ATP-binding cassette domain-containing protein [Anaerolineaceae bacterium]|nr:ATP-binding cassette domain-containing protein [Anaerolineaceae bacterium]